MVVMRGVWRNWWGVGRGESESPAPLQAVGSRFPDSVPKTHDLDAFVVVIDDVDDPPRGPSHAE
jgi:hypothetical protein